MIKISILYKLKFIFIFFTLFLGIFQIPASNQGTYMIHILFYIAFVVIGHVRYKQATLVLFSLVEIGITTWLVQHYGMPVVLLLLAPVFSYVPANISRVHQIIVMGIHLLAVNYVLWHEAFIFNINIVIYPRNQNGVWWQHAHPSRYCTQALWIATPVYTNKGAIRLGEGVNCCRV